MVVVGVGGGSFEGGGARRDVVVRDADEVGREGGSGAPGEGGAV